MIKFFAAFRRRLFSPRLVLCSERVQREGTEGDDIQQFQSHFNRRARRYEIRVQETGVYDKQTRLAVAGYQRAALSIGTADGYVGPQTARKLGIKLIGD